MTTVNDYPACMNLGAIEIIKSNNNMQEIIDGVTKLLAHIGTTKMVFPTSADIFKTFFI